MIVIKQNYLSELDFEEATFGQVVEDHDGVGRWLGCADLIAIVLPLGVRNHLKIKRNYPYSKYTTLFITGACQSGT